MMRIRRALWVVSIGFILWAAMMMTAPQAASALGPPGCDPGDPPSAANVPCEGWPVTSVPPPSGVMCKLEVFNGSGTSVVPPATGTCYPPGITPPANSFPCMVIVSPTAYGQGYCTSTPGPPQAGFVAPPPPPPPAPPVVSGASCTKAPPSKWYDPQDSGYGVPSVSPSWLPQAKNFGSTLFKALFVFEIFMLGLQAVLHRNDITHLFSGFAFKTFVATFFIYLMSLSPTIFPKVFGSFQIAGQSVGASSGGNLMSMYTQADKAAELFFCAAMASHIDDRESALQYGYFGNMPGHPGIPNNGDFSHTLQSAVGHITFEFFVQGLGMLVIAGAGIMFLSLALITAESYITMFAGVFFLGFSSTRFTLPFTQGYLAYAVNVGVKMFTYWVLIAVESSMLMPVLLRAGTGLINAASIQFGPGSEMYLWPASVDVAQILAMGALTWFLPGVVGRFVSGRNSPSTMRVITKLASSIKNTPAAVAAFTGSVPAGPLSPAQLSQGSTPMPLLKEGMTPIAHPAAGMSNPFFAQAQAFVSPSSPTSTASAAAAASFDNGATISGIYKQPVQVSVSDGPDPFTFKPKVEPIVLPAQPRNKRSAVHPPIKSHAEDETPRPSIQPNASFGSDTTQLVRKNADAKPSAAPLEDLPLHSSSPAQTLNRLSPQQMKLLPPEEFASLLETTQWNTLSAEHLEAIEEDERLRSIADEIISKRRRAPETS